MALDFPDQPADGRTWHDHDLKVMPNQTEPTVKPFDLSGFILLMIAMVGLSLGIENIAAPQYSRLVSISLLVMGTIATIGYAYHAIAIKMRCFMAACFSL